MFVSYLVLVVVLGRINCTYERRTPTPNSRSTIYQFIRGSNRIWLFNVVKWPTYTVIFFPTLWFLSYWNVCIKCKIVFFSLSHMPWHYLYLALGHYKRVLGCMSSIAHFITIVRIMSQCNRIFGDIILTFCPIKLKFSSIISTF